MTGLLHPSERVPLMLLPGTLCDGRLFAPLRARLALRPFLDRDLEGESSCAVLADRLLAGAPDRFALLGFSLGAIVALEMAHRAPHRIAGLALVGGNAHPVAAADRDARRADVAAVRAAADHVAALWPTYAHAAADPALRDAVVAMAADAPAGTLRRQTEVALGRADSRPRLAALRLPTLVLAGANDRINPPPVQCAMAGAIAGAELALVPRAGHFVPLEQPDATAEAVARWLARVDARTSPSPPLRFKELT